MRKIFLSVFIAILVGCTNRVYIHNIDDLESGQLSVVKTLTGGGTKYNAWIHFVYDESGNEITGRKKSDGGLGEVHLPEGKYTFNVICTSGYLEGDMKLNAFIKTGKNYQIFCDVSEKSNFLGLTSSAKGMVRIREVE